MKILTTLAVALALTGCATCSQHPVACTVGTAFVVGSIAATVELNSHGDHHQRDVRADHGAVHINHGSTMPNCIGSNCQ